MKVDVLFARMAVRDLGRARRWYECIFGRPADVIPNEQEVMWKVTDSAWVYVIDDRERAGHGVVALVVPDLDDEIAAIAARGITAGPIERIGDAGRKAAVRDPDGNSVSLIEVADGR